jgi:hypothetical protein
MQATSKSSERTVFISLKDQKMKYLSGHVIDGRNLFPAVGYLVSCKMQYVTNVMCFPFDDVTLFLIYFLQSKRVVTLVVILKLSCWAIYYVAVSKYTACVTYLYVNLLNKLN